MKKVVFLAFCFSLLAFLLPTVSYGCELIVNEQGKWVNEDGSEALQRDIDACLEKTRESFGKRGMFVAVSTILFMVSVPLTIFTFMIVILFAVQKKKLKGPLILFAIPFTISLVIYMFSIF